MERGLIVVNSYKGLLLVQAEAALIEVEHPHKGRGEGKPPSPQFWSASSGWHHRGILHTGHSQGAVMRLGTDTET